MRMIPILAGSHGAVVYVRRQNAHWRYKVRQKPFDACQRRLTEHLRASGRTTNQLMA
jgi:hypothetical protein